MLCDSAYCSPGCGKDSRAYFHLLQQIAPNGSKEDVPQISIDMSGLSVRKLPLLHLTYCHRVRSYAYCCPPTVRVRSYTYCRPPTVTEYVVTPTVALLLSQSSYTYCHPPTVSLLLSQST